MTARFRTIPAGVEAVRWVGEGNCDEVFAFIGEEHSDDELRHSMIYVPNSECDMIAYPGDWIVRNAAGKFEVYADSDFTAKYEQAATDRGFAWHELRLFSGPHPLDGGGVDQYEIGHAAECAALPPGAVCWAVREPFRWWWPTARGVYRIRPEDVLLGGDEDGPDCDVTLHVQVRDEAGGWVEYEGDTAGAEPDNGEYDAIVERIKTATIDKAMRQAVEQAEQDDDVRAVAEVCADSGNDEGPRGIRRLYARFAERIAELEARATDGGAS